MSEKPDKESKTELATEKKLEDARKKGNVPVSREPANLAYLIAGLFVFTAMLEYSVNRLSSPLAMVLQEAGSVRLANEADAISFVSAIGWDVIVAVAPVLLMFAAAGVAAAVLQNAPIPVLSRIKPEFSRLSLIKGLTRMFGLMGLMEMGKTLFRFMAFLACGAMLMQYIRVEVQNSALIDPLSSLFLTRDAIISVLLALLVASTLLLILDLPMTRVFWHRELRMTKQEVKDEHKESEGDPLIKARRRSIARSRLRRMNLAAVPKATVVITNPTHFAVALQYIREEGGAPKVVAKGQDLIALEIRRIAEENSIPIIEDKLLARSLYAKVEVDQMIPIEFYRIVAEILIRLQARRKSTPVRA
ncbi:MAG TPA: flagellar type III secretion system protein FlhB [Hyphomicrobium sp.]|nr:flagellar type III secretion system protein FlhB [Hyphomicrobium sp.]